MFSEMSEGNGDYLVKTIRETSHMSEKDVELSAREVFLHPLSLTYILSLTLRLAQSPSLCHIPTSSFPTPTRTEWTCGC